VDVVLVFVRTLVKARRERETRERAEHRCSGARTWTGSLTSGEYLEGTYLPYRQGWERSLAVSCSFCMLHAPPTPRPWDPLAAEIPGPDQIAFSPRRAFCGTIFIQLGCGCLARMLPKAHPLACNACNSWRYFVAPSQCATRRVLSRQHAGIAATQPSGLCLLANPRHSSWSAAAFHDASPFTNKPARAVLGVSRRWIRRTKRYHPPATVAQQGSADGFVRRPCTVHPAKRWLLRFLQVSRVLIGSPWESSLGPLAATNAGCFRSFRGFPARAKLTNESRPQARQASRWPSHDARAAFAVWALLVLLRSTETSLGGSLPCSNK
jgi:hypothetical protein